MCEVAVVSLEASNVAEKYKHVLGASEAKGLLSWRVLIMLRGVSYDGGVQRVVCLRRVGSFLASKSKGESLHFCFHLRG